MTTLQEQSRKFVGAPRDRPTADDVKQGTLLRIADATELIAKNYAELVQQRDMYLRWYNTEHENSARLKKQVAGLQGVITKMKKVQEGKR